MSDLNPKEILESYHAKRLDKASAFTYLRSFIDNGNDETIRAESLKLLGEIGFESEAFFKFLENLLVSDSNESIRAVAAELIIQNFLDKAEALINWTFEKEPSMDCLLAIFKSLRGLNDDKSRGLINLLENALERRFSDID
ncbi:MAG: hypothetical protein ACFFAN_05965 [Promethearchaeota archaeon]